MSSPAELVRGDALTGEGLAEALEGVDVAYYLIHSMERIERARDGARPFQERERIAAETFAQRLGAGGRRAHRVPRRPARRRAGRFQLSRHLSSREGVERILLAAVPDSVALRASIVIGARSRSFRLLVRLVERMRVLALPAWRRFRNAADRRARRGADARRIGDRTGRRTLARRGRPDVLSYGEMIERIADLMLVNRPSVGLGVNITGVTARVAAAIAHEDPELVLPLMESLNGDLLPADDRAAELLDVRMHSFDSAVEHALGEWEAHEPLAAR